jgi:hypothetical protein
MTTIEERVAVLESQHVDSLRMHGEILGAIQRVKTDVIDVLETHAEGSKVRCEMRHRDINARLRSQESMFSSIDKNRIEKWKIIAALLAALMSGVGASFATGMFHHGTVATTK